MTVTTPMPTTRLARATAAAACALAVLLTAACGSDATADGATDRPGGARSGDASGFPVTVASGQLGATTDLTIEQEPQRIVSLSPSATETLWAVGAGDQVTAVDDQSDYPRGVPTTKLSGFQPNVEAILGYSPDLVVAADDTDGLVSDLRKAGVPVLLLPAPRTLHEAWSQMERLGAATGHVAEGAALAAHVKQSVDDAAAKAARAGARGLTYFHELDPSLYTVTGKTFIGQLYRRFGFTSIADTSASGDDYPRLSPEYVVSADPDLVVLTDTGYGDVSVRNVADRPGWADMSAVRGGHVIEVDPDISSRWGPRLADFADLLARQAESLAPAAAR